MATQTKTTTPIALELPPEGGALSPSSTLEEDAHYLRVTLDKSENMKAAAGQRLAEMLQTKFGGNRNALRDWYEAEVDEGKAHRAWSTVERYLAVVQQPDKYPDPAAEFDRRAGLAREHDRRYREKLREGGIVRDEDNELNELDGATRITRTPRSEYEQRELWLSQGDYWWFKGMPEWQSKWLEKHGFRKP